MKDISITNWIRNSSIFSSAWSLLFSKSWFIWKLPLKTLSLESFCSFFSDFSSKWSNNNIQFTMTMSGNTPRSSTPGFQLEHQNITATKLEIMNERTKRKSNNHFPENLFIIQSPGEIYKNSYLLIIFFIFPERFHLPKKIACFIPNGKILLLQNCFLFRPPFSGIFHLPSSLALAIRRNVGRNCDMVHQTSCLCSTNCKMIMFRILIIFESVSWLCRGKVPAGNFWPCYQNAWKTFILITFKPTLYWNIAAAGLLKHLFISLQFFYLEREKTGTEIRRNFILHSSSVHFSIIFYIFVC
jgi:hypothetical protein